MKGNTNPFRAIFSSAHKVVVPRRGKCIPTFRIVHTAAMPPRGIQNAITYSTNVPNKLLRNPPFARDTAAGRTFVPLTQFLIRAAVIAPS